MAIAVTSEKLGQKATNNLLSPAYITNGLVFTSGQLGYDFEAQKFGVSVEEQTELAISQLERVLKASGSDLGMVVKVLAFVSHASHASIFNKVYAKYFPQKPARSLIIVQFPNPDVTIEIECVAEVGNSSKL